MSKLLIYQPTIVNEGKVFVSNIIIDGGIIERITKDVPEGDYQTIDATGLYLLPGIVDTHVHFREPGLTHKATIRTESAAAIAGGVTSFIDMPNTIPNTTSYDEFLNKHRLASGNSYANYAFYIGANSENQSEILAHEDPRIFGFTDDGLYFTNTRSLLVEQPELLEHWLRCSSLPVSIHSEMEEQIEKNLEKARENYGAKTPFFMHPYIRNEEVCVQATTLALSIAKQTDGKLHVLHLSTAKEAQLFDVGDNLRDKKITSEVCVNHLWFTDEDYMRHGANIKCNPSIKSIEDQTGLLKALNEDRIDIISTDHAPHLENEKSQDYFNSPSGIPMIQHSLNIMLELAKQNMISLEKIVEKMCHNPCILFGIENRGFVREGYYADLVLVDLQHEWFVTRENIFYKCGWSPLEGECFSTKVKTTIVNGKIAFDNDGLSDNLHGKALTFKHK
jgi:dihydroorotase